MPTTDSLQSRLDFIGLDQTARQRQARAKAHVDKHLPIALDKFYAKIARVPAVSRFFDGKKQMDQVQSRQVGHWQAIADGAQDDAYFAASSRVGLRHAEIGLEPRWHIGGYGVILETLVTGVVHDMMTEALQPKKGRFGKKAPSTDEVMAAADEMALTLASLMKSTLLDIDIGVTAYFDKLTEDRRLADEAANAKICRAVTLTGEVLKQMAAGDLTGRITAEFDPEFAQIKDDTNAVADRLTDIVGQLRETSRALKIATSEILSGANDLADRTTKQAATIEQTSAAVEQLSLVVVENARRTATASGKAQLVAQNATAGGTVMEQANAAMSGIASVEAARAGDAGKGFAVVAVEVRRLAQSAANASADVKTLIEASAREVQSGTRLVGQAAETLLDILAGAQESATLIDTIAQANKDQASSLEEVAIAVRQMDEMTQHNAALVEQTNAAIEQTESQASDLDGIVDVFRITSSRPAPVARAPRFRAGPVSVGNTALAQDWNEF